MCHLISILMKHTQITDKCAPHTQMLHNFVKVRKRYRLSQAAASAHSPKAKLELMLDFHCIVSSGSILILCPKMEQYDYYDN